MEVDRGTEAQYLIDDDNDIATKAERYGRYLKAIYPTAQFFEDLPTPIVLWLTAGQDRRQRNMMKEIRAAGGKGAHWLSTTHKLYPNKQADSFWQPIWTTADGEIRSLLDRVCLTHLS